MSDAAMIEPGVVAERLASIRARVAQLRSDPIDIVAVTKGFGVDAMLAALAAGCRDLGENYANECTQKLDLLDELVPPEDRRVHFIGQLQTNKVRQLAGRVDVYESVDRERLVREIARRDRGAALLIQVNSTDEANKGGCRPDEVGSLIDLATREGMSVLGLMTVGPTSQDAAETARAFGVVRRLVDEFGLEICSMGMTHDLEIAVAEGSTQLRIGTALFGQRSPSR
jgi:pyridoxal phosphate enzyme (YggS family)